MLRIESFLDELRARAMLYDKTKGLESCDAQKAYVGFDPTAPSLHIGNLATLMLLVHAQRAGIKPVVLIGGATAMIGDPSGKNTERPLLDERSVRENEEKIRNQLSHFLDFEGPTAAELHNNYDWFKNMRLLHFLRETGKHFPLSYLIAKDTVRSRLEQGISFAEFGYQLIQAYDFYHLYTTHGVELQMGGSDQWGNITAGIELIRRRCEQSAYGLTAPLITRDDGSKFGKSEGENIWLDEARTSPYALYQFWYNLEDKACRPTARIFTLLDEEKLTALEHEQQRAPHLRSYQRAIAEDITTRVHGEASCRQVIAASALLFGEKQPFEAAAEVFVTLAKEIPYAKVPRTALEDIAVLLCSAAEGLVVSSRTELRRLIAAGGLYINNHRIELSTNPKNIRSVHDRYLLVRRGKKQFYLLELT